MSFTKVAPAGIGTEPGTSILIGDSLLHSTGIDLGHNTGIGVTIRKHGDATFTGIITASAFFGDGSGLEGVSSSGIGTPLSDDDTSQLNKIYYVNQELSIGSTVTVNHPDSAIASYTHYQDLVVTNDADFIVSDGDTFIPDVLGINTASLPNPVSGATGGRIRAGTITNAGANGAPNFPNGLTGTAGTFTGNLNVGGVLTYEDVTNVDSVGVITARSGIKVSAGTSSLLIGSAHASGQRNAVEIHSSPNDGLTISRDGGGSDTDLVLLKNTNNSGTIEVRNSSNAQKIFLDSSGASHISGGILGIQNTSPGSQYFNNLVVGNNDSGDKGITIRSSSSNSGVLAFSDADSGTARYAGYISYSHSTNNMVFHTLAGDARMTITSQGYVTKPHQPAFRAGCSSDLNPGANGTIIFQDVTTTGSHFNVGGHYSTTTGAFTAPVAGIYNFYTQILWESMNNGEDMHDAIFIMYNTSGGGTGGNLVSYDARRAEYVAGTTGNSGYYGAFTTVMVNMVAGSSVYVRNKNNLTVHGNRNFTYFQGYLIG